MELQVGDIVTINGWIKDYRDNSAIMSVKGMQTQIQKIDIYGYCHFEWSKSTFSAHIKQCEFVSRPKQKFEYEVYTFEKTHSIFEWLTETQYNHFYGKKVKIIIEEK